MERYDGYSYGYALLAKHEFGYVLGKHTLYWPSITTPYRWSGMTNHELLRNQATGVANRPPQWFRPPTSATLIRPDQPLQRLGPYETPTSATLIRPDQPLPRLGPSIPGAPSTFGSGLISPS